MPGGIELAELLAGKRRQLQERNPFLQGAQVAMSDPMQGASGWQAVMGRALAGLLGGGMQAYGKKQAEGQYQQYLQGLPEVLAGAPRPGYEDVTSAMKIQEQQRQQALQDLELKEKAKTKYKSIKAMNILEEGGKMHQEFFDPATGQTTRGPSVERGKGVNVRVEQPSFFEKEIYEKQLDTTKVVRRTSKILKQLDKFDSKETIAGAIKRKVGAKLMSDTEAYELDRSLLELAVMTAKPSFPGQLSEQENKWMQEIVGKQSAALVPIPVPVLKSIIKKVEENIVEDTEEARNIATSAGFKVKIPPLKASRSTENNPNKQRLIDSIKSKLGQ